MGKEDAILDRRGWGSRIGDGLRRKQFGRFALYYADGFFAAPVSEAPYNGKADIQRAARDLEDLLGEIAACEREGML